ncbi:MAG: alkaline shock response membrane anchor protein AmaP [PVC group bacterium]|nr:alkaline shock response membrane anchor protein AmaP [PVC group bacterium]
MRIFNKIIVFFYTLIFSLIGACLIMVASHLAGWIDLTLPIEYVIDFPDLPWLLLLSGSLLILVSLSLASISFKKFQEEKTIGYATNGGQVIISLSAIEDFIRRLTQQLTEVRELRSEVFVTRRGIEIESRVILWSTSNIPNITERIQETIKGQVQELLSGIDKPVMVNVHVIKITQKPPEKNIKDKKSKQEIPFLR